MVYTDVWVSMGEPKEIWEERIRELSPYRVDRGIMENAGEGAVFMHCLPAFHDLKTETGAQIEKSFGIREMEVSTSTGSGKYFWEVQAVKCIPVLAQATIREFPIL